MAKIFRAGVIPYYFNKLGELRMLFMKPSDPKFGGDQFQISKGKQEENEQPFDAALREGSEELGLKVLNVETVHPLGTFLGRTEIFLAKIKDPSDFGEPHFETGETKWMSIEEFKAAGRDIHKPIVKAAIELLKVNGELPGD
jgi:8-oxo-dGTP pyrophosphatase MutT (NUDIX family)